MKAISLLKTGGVENLKYIETDLPLASNNQVLVKVKAIGINPIDIKCRANLEILKFICQAPPPLILGWDIAGIVTHTGKNVNDFKVGDRVFGMINFPGIGNAYSEIVACNANQLAKIPNEISFTDAAATSLAALTALQTLTKANIKTGDNVLIHSGSGGVGHFAIQIAKSLGAFVYTTCSRNNAEFVKSLGADIHIDYRNEDFTQLIDNITFTLDTLGGKNLLKSLKVMKQNSVAISLPDGNFSDDILALSKEKNIDLSFYLVKSNGNDMRKLSNYIKDGTINVHVSKVFPFNEMARAHLEIESHHTVGKIVVKIT
ncbi:NADP-dependent oxidoreductase [Lentisphaerota bacterium WC36G]|nr:NADP-dependent oxidoreductase [Lentisphaerae bacterium WC36]